MHLEIQHKMVACSAVMSRPQKFSKLLEEEEQGYVDRISNLPDELLGYMLSFLPTRCAVSTSILSSRWRCLHMLTNSLTFDEYPPANCLEPEVKALKKRFKKFVNRVLLFHKVSPIKKFHFSCGGYVFDDSQIHAWISVAIFKRVEQLHLCLNATLNALPQSLFASTTIVELKINLPMDAFRVPGSIHLPNLKIIDFKNIAFLDRDSFCKLLNACSLLQELEIRFCKWPMDYDGHARLSLGELKHLVIAHCEGRVEVDAPNLEYLYYSVKYCFNVALSLKNPDRLVTAHLGFSSSDTSNAIGIALGLALIKAVYHVKELEFLRETVQYLTCSEDDHIPLYPNLVKLKLGECAYEAWKYIRYWLANSPRLETLIFDQKLIRVFVRQEKWPVHVALAPFASRVKVIEVSDFCGYITELVLVKYLLGNAQVLKKLILHKSCYDMTKNQEIQAGRKLLMYPRASKTCIVQLRKTPYD